MYRNKPHDGMGPFCTAIGMRFDHKTCLRNGPYNRSGMEKRIAQRKGTLGRINISSAQVDAYAI
jgi:hypothetical protein